MLSGRRRSIPVGSVGGRWMSSPSWFSKRSAISTAPSSQAVWKASRTLSDKRRPRRAVARAMGHCDGCRVGSCERLTAMADKLANNASTENQNSVINTKWQGVGETYRPRTEADPFPSLLFLDNGSNRYQPGQGAEVGLPTPSLCRTHPA